MKDKDFNYERIRVIKFKAKRLSDGEWVKGDLIQVSEKNIQIYNKDCGGEDFSVDPSTVCQYTGLKDEDGTEIWEHDILRNYPMINEVIFRNGSFMIVEDYGDDIVEIPLSNCVLEDNICYLRVIGNKFDRKEGEK